MHLLLINVLVVVTSAAAGHRIGKRAEPCVLPPYPTDGTYDVVSNPNAKPGDSLDAALLNVTCSQGYGVIGKTVVVCVGGEWSIKMPECEKFCQLSSHLSVEYQCFVPGSDSTRLCREYEPSGTTVRPECRRPNYYHPTELPYMRCVGGSWDYVAACFPECGRVSVENEPPVSDSISTRRGELPWHVGIYRKKKHDYICAGSLISNTVVLSVAHCFWNKKVRKLQPASGYEVAIGKLYRSWNDERDKGAQKSDVKDIKIPPRFQGGRANFQDDIAVLTLETAFVYKTFIRPVCLDFDLNFDKKQLRHGNLGKIFAWSHAIENGSITEILKVEALPYVNVEICLDNLPLGYGGYITSDKFCGGYINGTARCKGDTGAGLAFPETEQGTERYYIRGILATPPVNATHNLCNIKELGAFTRIKRQEIFLKDALNECPDGSDDAYGLCNTLQQTSNPPKTKKTVVAGQCVLPPYPEHGIYTVSNAPYAVPGQGFQSLQLNVTCHAGYGVTGDDTVFCQSGTWSSPIPKCVRFCKLDNNPSVRYNCLVPDSTGGHRPCRAYEPSGTVVNPDCNRPNYYSSSTLPYMRCTEGTWDYVAVCTPECGRVTPNGVDLIIDGVPAQRGELPWHVGIYRKKQGEFIQICGGSLVTSTVVISAAHCFWKDLSKKQPATNYAVAAGKLYRAWNDDRDDDVQKSEIKSIEIPSKFLGRDGNYQEDIAVLILEIPFIYRTHVRPVCLNFDYNFDRTQLKQGKLGKVAGWGLTSVNGNASEVLKVAELPYVAIDQCIQSVPLEFREHITGDKICAGYTNGTVLCRGDSGGGLSFPTSVRGIDRFYLRGIVSAAPTSEDLCTGNTLTAFTHVLRHEHFVKQYLRN